MSKRVNQSFKNLRELLLDASFSFVTTALETCHVVLHAHLIVAHGPLKPLDKVKEASGMVVEIQREIQ